MSVDKPPSLGSLDNPTQQLKQWGQHVPQDILQVDRAALNQWLGAIGNFVDAVNAQVAAARGLKINEGVVGNFQSAKATARQLNDSGDAIRQRLSEYVTFASALRDFSGAAYNAILNADAHRP
jgi:hypothetical protein